MDIARVLENVPGAKLRQSGGVCSDFDLSINGFSGKRIKYFFDGVPMDNFGSSFQINNIPVNLAERIEVYKGVVPIWSGSDALGGAVNIITGSKRKNFLDVSYSFGSFNTHRSTINAGFTSKNGFTVRLNAFQNYSDNNYKVDVDVADLYTGTYNAQKVRRFHDTYHNEVLTTQLGFIEKKWADELLVGITLGKNYKEIQTGARMVSVFGQWHTKGNIVMPSIKYLKNDFILKRLNLSINGNYNLGEERNIDTAHVRYNWLEDFIEYNGNGGESSYPTNYKYKNNIANATTTLTYEIQNKHFFALNNVYSHFNRKGQDSFPTEREIQIPQKTDKNILGFSYQYMIPNKWNVTIFGKHLYQKAKIILEESDILSPNEITYTEAENKRNKIGYGLAASYYILPQFQLKASFEKAYRLPESNDIFGDLINLDKNWNIQPEFSYNLNLGLNYWFKLKDNHKFYLNVNGIYYQAKDYIVYTFNALQNKLIANNYYDVSNLGIEGELRYTYKKFLSSGFNLSYQNIRDRQEILNDPISGISIPNVNYKERIPNIPYFFGNADTSVNFDNFFSNGDKITFGYNLSYMHSFYLYSAKLGNSSSKYNVPEQWSHDLNIVYSMKSGKYNIGLECRNLTDEKLYDNFSPQKPRRAFYIKLRYFITK